MPHAGCLHGVDPVHRDLVLLGQVPDHRSRALLAQSVIIARIAGNIGGGLYSMAYLFEFDTRYFSVIARLHENRKCRFQAV